MPLQQFNTDMESLLLKELELNGVNLRKKSWLSSESVVHEILALIASPSLHEGRIHGSGAIFVEDVTELAGAECVAFPLRDIELVRKLADGTGSFLLYCKDRFYGLVYFAPPLMTELQLLRVFPPSGGLFIQREASGETKFFQGENIILHENRVWHVKPHMKEAEWKISQCLSSVNRPVLRGILELSFHLVSPSPRVGATLVWCMGSMSPGIPEILKRGKDISCLGLSIQDRVRSTAICHLLSQVDGATFIDPSGLLICTEIHLKYSDTSRDLIPEFKGTRHTSAQRFSFDYPDTLTVTVSEDGPVSAFLNGANLVALKIQSPNREIRILKASSPDAAKAIRHRFYERTCSRCGKNSMIDQIDVAGSNEKHEISCPVCHAFFHQAICFSLECRPFRRVPN